MKLETFSREGPTFKYNREISTGSSTSGSFGFCGFFSRGSNPSGLMLCFFFSKIGFREYFLEYFFHLSLVLHLVSLLGKQLQSNLSFLAIRIFQ